MNSNDLLNQYKEQEVLKIFSDILKKIKTKPDLISKFAGVLINASIVEYLVEVLIYELKRKINIVCIKNKLNISFKYLNTNNLSRGARKNILKYFDFNERDQIINLLDKIYKNRDNVVHKLITASTHGVDIDKSILEVQEDADKLRILIAATLNLIWKSYGTTK